MRLSDRLSPNCFCLPSVRPGAAESLRGGDSPGGDAAEYAALQPPLLLSHFFSSLLCSRLLTLAPFSSFSRQDVLQLCLGRLNMATTSELRLYGAQAARVKE